MEKEAIEKFGLPIVPDEKSGALQWVDLRELKIRYTISIENTKKFFEALREGKLLATKCKCGRLFFPPQRDCPSCMKSEMGWVELKREGVLETLTVIFVRPPSFSAYDPYAVAIAKLDDGVRILSWLKGDPKKVVPGQRVRVEVSQRKEGYLMFELVPI
ncbi:MAG: Zn-ribbon domain-containing OB-fold protein [Archaeoglobaceae archaeon]